MAIPHSLKDWLLQRQIYSALIPWTCNWTSATTAAYPERPPHVRTNLVRGWALRSEGEQSALVGSCAGTDWRAEHPQLTALLRLQHTKPGSCFFSWGQPWQWELEQLQKGEKQKSKMTKGLVLKWYRRQWEICLEKLTYSLRRHIAGFSQLPKRRSERNYRKD